MIDTDDRTPAAFIFPDGSIHYVARVGDQSYVEARALFALCGGFYGTVDTPIGRLRYIARPRRVCPACVAVVRAELQRARQTLFPWERPTLPGGAE